MESKIKESDDNNVCINLVIVKSLEEITRDRQINKFICVIIEFEVNIDGETTRKLIMARRNRSLNMEDRMSMVSKIIPMKFDSRIHAEAFVRNHAVLGNILTFHINTMASVGI